MPETVLDPILLAHTVDELASGLMGVNKLKDKLVFSHTLEYMFLLHSKAMQSGEPVVTQSLSSIYIWRARASKREEAERERNKDMG